jgi:hypothetical protein
MADIENNKNYLLVSYLLLTFVSQVFQWRFHFKDVCPHFDRGVQRNRSGSTVQHIVVCCIWLSYEMLCIDLSMLIWLARCAECLPQHSDGRCIISILYLLTSLLWQAVVQEATCALCSGDVFIVWVTCSLFGWRVHCLGYLFIVRVTCSLFGWRVHCLGDMFIVRVTCSLLGWRVHCLGYLFIVRVTCSLFGWRVHC